MRIALIAPIVTPIAQPFLGGSQAMVAQLAQGLQQRGHEVTLFARQGSAVPEIKIEELVVPESVVPARFSAPSQERPADPGFFAQANIFLDLFLQLRQRQHEFDLVHAHAFDWPAFTLSALLTAIPVIHTIHLPAVTPEINEALRLFHQQGHPLRLITVSQACARTYEPYTPFDHIIYNGLDTDVIHFAPHIEPDAPLLFAGRITPEKGVEAALEIAERANVPETFAAESRHEEKLVPCRNLGLRLRRIRELHVFRAVAPGSSVAVLEMRERRAEHAAEILRAVAFRLDRSERRRHDRVRNRRRGRAAADRVCRREERESEQEAAALQSDPILPVR